MNLKTFFVTMISIAGFSALAADGSSGCGPGWYLLKENSLVSSSLRATTNSALSPVTTIGMTVGTSNCTQHKLVETEKESLHFVTHNYFELKAESAKGDGAYIAALSQTMGCDSRALNVLPNVMKKSYQNIFPQNKVSPSDSLVEIYKVILTNPELVRSCSLASLG